MAFTFERVNNREIRRIIYVATKVIVGFLVLIYFGGSLVICNEDIPFCDKRLEELENDVKDWRKRCLNGTGHMYNSSCCAAENERNQQRMEMQTKLCFYKGPYPEPYLFINENSGIHAIDLLTDDKTVVIPGLKENYGMATDKAEMKIYFRNGSSIYRANFDGTGVEIVLQNVDIWKMELDWITRRLLLISRADGQIYLMHLHDKEKRKLTETGLWSEDIAVDPTVG
ncbi:Hypothetical predicted protein, partial [Paramuricea clavata]